MTLFLERNVKAKISFKKGETVVRQGEVINYLYLLVEGVVRTQMITQEGNVSHVLCVDTVSYTHLRAHETRHDLVCRLLLEKKKKQCHQSVTLLVLTTNGSQPLTT
eukprot:TRINITY_DN5308_c0_g1_i2.p1 TRINITY_DN5308_c0_g1~~TRINITY_DN5308_c0_g1_i2.p1  ORF type:complete len:106 (+),score=5.02 TRINITY_DN5308_c0_g1_i2:415-732(+)